MDILVMGYNAFDVTVVVQGELPAADSKHAVPAILHGGGGPGATAAICLARLGARVRLVTVFGDDQGAALQRRELADAGVDYSLSRTAAGHPSPQAVILVDPDRETRTIFWSRGSLPPLNSSAVDPRWLDGCDLFYCDGHEPAAAAILARAAHARGLAAVMDAGTLRGGSDRLVACCSDVISSRGFALQLTGCADPLTALRAMRARGPRRVAMTFGAAGALALDEDGREAFHVPAYAVAVRDTTGAGDVFHAGYAFARARGDCWRASLELGAAVAALKCRDWGGRRGLPTLAEAEQLRAQGAPRSELPEGWPPFPA